MMSENIQHESVQITFPDGTVKAFDKNTTAREIAKRIAKKLYKAAIAAKINDKVMDLSTPITEDSQLQILTFEDPEGREVYRHSSAHILAQAVLEIFPNAKPTIGPPLADSFYYDFDVETPFTPEDLQAIGKRANQIIRQNLHFERRELTREEALTFYRKEVPNHYKGEIIEDYPDEASWSFLSAR